MAYPKGRKWTDEQRNKLRGRMTWNKGIPRTAKEKQSIRQGLTSQGRARISESKKEMWAAGKYDWKGIKNPTANPEVRKKISEANRKRVISEATRKKISNAKKGRSNGPLKESVKQSFSKRMKESNPMFREEVIKNHPILNGCKTSSGEKDVKRILKKMGLRFDFQKIFKRPDGKRHYIADFYLPDYNKIIEFDGFSAHHESVRDAERDQTLLNTYGAKTLRITTEDFFVYKQGQIEDKIKGFLYEC